VKTAVDEEKLKVLEVRLQDISREMQDIFAELATDAKARSVDVSGIMDKYRTELKNLTRRQFLMALDPSGLICSICKDGRRG
jgi:hypothetical protein